MSDTLGQGQSVTQAVVVSQEVMDPNTAPMKVSLFKQDGTPFLADTATVFSTMVLVAQDLTDDAFEALTGGDYPLPYPLTIAIINQSPASRNGLYQGQTGAPDTEGPQRMKRISDLPVDDAVVGAVYAIGETNVEDPLDAEDVTELTSLAREGGFMFGSVDTGAGRVWGTLYNGARINEIEERLEALES